jgi:hypothetical protein
VFSRDRKRELCFPAAPPGHPQEPVRRSPKHLVRSRVIGSANLLFGLVSPLYPITINVLTDLLLLVLQWEKSLLEYRSLGQV